MPKGISWEFRLDDVAVIGKDEASLSQIAKHLRIAEFYLQCPATDTPRDQGPPQAGTNCGSQHRLDGARAIQQAKVVAVAFNTMAEAAAAQRRKPEPRTTWLEPSPKTRHNRTDPSAQPMRSGKWPTCAAQGSSPTRSSAPRRNSSSGCSADRRHRRRWASQAGWRLAAAAENRPSGTSRTIQERLQLA